MYFDFYIRWHSMHTDTNGCFVLPCSPGELQIQNLNSQPTYFEFESSFLCGPVNSQDLNLLTKNNCFRNSMHNSLWCGPYGRWISWMTPGVYVLIFLGYNPCVNFFIRIIILQMLVWIHSEKKEDWVSIPSIKIHCFHEFFDMAVLKLNSLFKIANNE